MQTSIMTDLPTISRSGGTSGDFLRMEDIIRTKLHNQLHTVTVFDFVDSIINYLLINADYSLAILKLLQPIIETAIAHYSTGHQRPSILAIACLMVYNNWYPHQPICSPWSLLHLTVMLKVFFIVNGYSYYSLFHEPFSSICPWSTTMPISSRSCTIVDSTISWTRGGTNRLSQGQG